MGTQDEIDRFRTAPIVTTLAPGAVPVTARPDRALSWRAVWAGAAGATALSLILLILGTGLGLSSISPWAQAGVSAATLGVSTILWITLTQVAASGMGGYLAGRLRDKWTATAPDEAYFRDTAHGFLAWAVATLATAALLSSAIGNILGTTVQAGAAMAGTAAGVAAPAAVAAAKAPGNDPTTPYLVDSLFRKGASAAVATTAPLAAANGETRPPIAEAARIIANAGRSPSLPPVDVQYLGQLVSQNTGVSQQEGESRVTAVYATLQTQLQATETAAREAADKARKASAYAALWLFVSLLAGAFVASLAATFGGRQRDA